MKINNKSVQGLYNYTSSGKYEFGDLVVLDGGLYRCVTSDDFVSGVNPSEDESGVNFIPYLGETANSLSEFEEYYKGDEGRGKDKLVSFELLHQILNKYLWGYDGSRNIIEVEEPSVFNDMLNSDEPVNIQILAKLLSMDSFEVEGSIELPNDEVINAYPGIFRQFVYILGRQKKVMQEFICSRTDDYSELRFVRSKDDVPQSWKLCNTGKKEIIEYLRGILNECNTNRERFLRMKNTIYRNFAYKSLPIENQNELSIIRGQSEVFPEILAGDTLNTYVTLTLKLPTSGESGALGRVENMTLDLVRGTDPKNFYITEDLFVIMFENNGEIFIRTSIDSLKIIGAYVRRYYQ